MAMQPTGEDAIDPQSDPYLGLADRLLPEARNYLIAVATLAALMAVLVGATRDGAAASGSLPVSLATYLIAILGLTVGLAVVAVFAHRSG